MDYLLLAVSGGVWLWVSYGKRLQWKYQLILVFLLVGYVWYRCRLANWGEFVTQLETVTAGLPLPTTIKTALRLTRNLSNYQPATTIQNNGKKVKRSVTAIQKKYVAARQKWKCQSCGALLDETYEVDHIVPLYQGGTNETNNLQALCRQCHGKKTIREYI